MDGPERTEHVERRVHELIAEGGGRTRLTTIRNALTASHRQLLPVILSSGAYAVTDEPGGLVVRIRETS